jgi:hypothetical protein
MTRGARPSATGGARASWAWLGRQPAGPWQAEGGEAACGGKLRERERTSRTGLSAERKGGLLGWSKGVWAVLSSLFFPSKTNKPI